MLAALVESAGCPGGKSECTHDGQTYAEGTTFPAPCNNHCSCGPGGAVLCTKNACVGDGGTPDEVTLDAAMSTGGDGGDARSDGTTTLDAVSTAEAGAASSDARPSVDGSTIADAAPADAAPGDAAHAVDAASVTDAGSSADGTSVTDAGASADRLCDFPEPYEFGLVGGFVAFQSRSYLSPGNRYRHVQTPVRSGGAAISCEPAMPPCAASYTQNPYQLVWLLLKPDVQAALAQQPPPFFGYDERPVDGQAFEVKNATGSFVVGSECSGRTPCAPIPQGIRELRGALEALDHQQLRDPVCVAAGFSP